MELRATEKSNAQVIFLSWGDIDNIISDLSQKVIVDGIPDIIIGIQRGGVIPSVVLSHMLGVRQFFTYNISRTINDEVNSKKVEPFLGNNIPLEFIKNQDVLVVDDIVGSGATISTLLNIIYKYSPARVRTLVCMVNKNNWEPINTKEPSELISYIGMQSRGWTIFPWEKHEGSA